VIPEFLTLYKDYLTEVLPFLAIGFFLVGLVHSKKSIWLACGTCQPERWVCTVCRKRKAFPELCPVRKIVLKRVENVEDILTPGQTIESTRRKVISVRQPVEIPKLPKLKIKTIPGYLSEEVRSLEQGIDLPFSDALIFAEGHRINSYEELVQLASQDTYMDWEFIEVVVLTIGIVTGG